MHVCVCVFTTMCSHVCAGMHACAHVCVCMFTTVCSHVYAGMRVCVCVCVCVRSSESGPGVGLEGCQVTALNDTDGLQLPRAP